MLSDNTVYRRPDTAVIALYGANASQTLQGDLALVAKLLVDGPGRDDVEAPLIQHHGICYAAVLLGKKAEHIDVGPPDGRRSVTADVPVSVSGVLDVAVERFGDGEHRLWGCGPFPCSST